LLTSALYYEGLWTIPFDPVNTVEGQFTTSANKSVTVPMMHGDGKYIYTEDSQRQMLLLTYKNSTLAMAFILPKNKENFGNIIRAFDYSQLMKLNQTSLTNAPTIAVSLPRFNIDKRFTDELTTALYYLGFSDASNFTNLAKPVQGELLPLNKIIQETLVEVSEEGATASMSTVAIKKQTSTARDPNIIYFIADHPFIYVLFDIKTGLILVIGHVATLPDMHQPDEIQSLHINELMRLIARITSNADSLAQMKGTYNYSTELTPDDKVRTSWDSIVTISNQTKDSYTVTITKVPSEVCKAVQVKLSQSPKYVAKNKCDTAEPADFTYIYNR